MKVPFHRICLYSQLVDGPSRKRAIRSTTSAGHAGIHPPQDLRPSHKNPDQHAATEFADDELMRRRDLQLFFTAAVKLWMTRFVRFPGIKTFAAVSFFAGLLAFSQFIQAQPAAASSAFDEYVHGVETRLARQHAAQSTFFSPGHVSTVAAGAVQIERLSPSPDFFPSGAMIHHWRGTAFVPGAKIADFERLMLDFPAYPRHFAPQIVQAKLLSAASGPVDPSHAQFPIRIQGQMRVRQKHIITVVLDSAYDVAFQRLDPRHGYSLSRSTHISEIDSAGTAAERALPSSQEHGFLWRLNTYWSYEERDGGLAVQVESVSLTRSIPTGLGWAVRPFVESVPRESLEFTLRSVATALRHE